MNTFGVVGDPSQALQQAALTPYQGSAAGGGAMGAASQLAMALMAKRPQQLGVPSYNTPGIQPGAAPNVMTTNFSPQQLFGGAQMPPPANVSGQ